jgi:hypothetical protein
MDGKPERTQHNERKDEKVVYEQKVIHYQGYTETHYDHQLFVVTRFEKPYELSCSARAPSFVVSPSFSRGSSSLQWCVCGQNGAAVVI